MTDSTTNQPVDEPAHATRDGVGSPQDVSTGELSDADREWLNEHRALAQQYYGTNPVADQPGVVTRPTVSTDAAANQETLSPEVPDDLDKSKPYYRLVHADGSESYQNGDLAIPTHGGEGGHSVTAAFLLPAEEGSK